jgi:hypothetical protein
MNTTTTQSQKEEIVMTIGSKTYTQKEATDYWMEKCDLYKNKLYDLEDKFRHNECDRLVVTDNLEVERKSKNGFHFYDIDNQSLDFSFNYETYQEIEDDIQRHIDEYERCQQATSVIIEFNGLVLTFNIKAHNDTLEYAFVSVEDA